MEIRDMQTRIEFGKQPEFIEKSFTFETGETITFRLPYGPMHQRDQSLEELHTRSIERVISLLEGVIRDGN
ncbi:hypothetical protein LP085_08640 [Achromobacter sp. MY14]|uniref:hypothetical protein n=1 Tax=unclassified Achromobacter TaxID=2626865 RepID=UPI001E2C4C25|nr:hypothetical protein [Achromobacter sp. MY14]MCD0496911.1 hypothetical protein [Achromobacter sp. MY14]